MICRNCGFKMNDDAKFCENCGTANVNIYQSQPQNAPYSSSYNNTYASSGMYPEQNPYQKSAYADVYPDINGYYRQTYNYQNRPDGNNYLYRDAVCREAKKHLSCAGFLIGTILFTLLVILQIASIYAGLMEIEVLYGIFDADAPMSAITALLLAAAVIFSIPAMVMALGLWLSYRAGRSKKSSGLKTGGLTTVKVILILQIIWIWIMIAAVLVLSAVLILNPDMLFMFGITKVLPVVIILACLIIAVFVLMIVYLIKAVMGINSIKFARSNGMHARISAFVCVFSIIIGIVLIIGSISFAFLTFLISSGIQEIDLSDILSAAQNVIQGIIYIIFGVVASKARSLNKIR